MSVYLKPLGISLKQLLLRFISPNGLMVAVGLIFLTVFLFSGSGIENRMVDGPTVKDYHAKVSPLLASAK